MLRLTLAFLLATPVLADVVVLKRGKLLEGKLVSFNKSELRLEIEAGQSVLHRSKIASVHFDVSLDQYRSRLMKAKAEKAQPERKGVIVPISNWALKTA